ncbi:MAG: response regulator [Deltaproteobacteria bacterium]|jgi:DNA-binding NarL/FixJ family response regulator|nr:response regulator [Deltaproteobacteria bacterium]
MSATVLFFIADEALRDKLRGYLEGEKFTLLEAALPIEPRETPGELAARLIKDKPDIVVMDYILEDAYSVKVLQEAIDIKPAVNFVFVEQGTVDMENVMMAFNEGVRGFIRKNVSGPAFINILSRAYAGPSRFRPVLLDEKAREDEIQRLGQKLSKKNVHLSSAQKLINYLLVTPLNMQPRRVLVLSDSGYQRELLKKILEDSNFIVNTAATIEEALGIMNAEKPRIIISDYGLEDGKTGVDFCREVKFVQKYGPCYFVVCTAGEDKLPLIMAPGNGVDDCILKPSTDSSISEFIARVSLGLIL